jgi:hypothetical protein
VVLGLQAYQTERAALQLGVNGSVEDTAAQIALRGSESSSRTRASRTARVSPARRYCTSCRRRTRAGRAASGATRATPYYLDLPASKPQRAQLDRTFS